MAGVDRELLASYVRNKMQKEDLSLRKAADVIKCSPATLSRLLAGSEGEYEPDTATLVAVGKWLGRNMSDFEPERRPARSTMTEVEMHMHALPDISERDATEMIAVVRALYASKRKRDTKK
jgi:transcriptional regulator with XRE-family HTH domain